MNLEERLFVDLPLYAENQLYIKPKSGPLIPFKMNRAQLYLHERIEEQKKRIGRVRIIILKGRQQGCSTYVASRFYHQTVTRIANLTFIFAHDSEASSSLYGMVKTFYEESDDPKFRPTLGASNAKELLFPGLRSGYKVGTAGTRGLGRSKTFQQIHWSEVAYSPNCDEHAAGILQTVPEEDGTEIILESTANGQGNYFHRGCIKAMAGSGDFELVFIPWYWQEEYTREVPEDFDLQQPREGEDYTSEQEYYDIYKEDGLTLEHISWRRHKIENDFQGDVEQFMREYPFTPEEAFMASASEAYIKPLLFQRSIKTKPVQTSAPLVFGVDPARLGKDSFKVTHRKGRNLTKHEQYKPMRLDQSTSKLVLDIKKYKPQKVFIDCGGLGVGLYDNLVGMGYGNVVVKVDFGGVALNPDLNKNMTAEMFREAREWLEDTPNSMQMLKPGDAQAIQTQISARRYKWDRNSVLHIESKDEFKKEFGFSPDDGDSFLLTFAQPIAPTLETFKMNETVVQTPDWNPFGV